MIVILLMLALFLLSWGLHLSLPATLGLGILAGLVVGLLQAGSYATEHPRVKNRSRPALGVMRKERHGRIDSKGNEGKVEGVRMDTL